LVYDDVGQLLLFLLLYYTNLTCLISNSSLISVSILVFELEELIVFDG